MTLLLRWISPVELAFPARLHLILLPDFQAAEAARKGYFRYNVEGRVPTVYVPAEQSDAIKDAQSAWRRFQEIGAEISWISRPVIAVA
jgi:hypothetical protein